MSYFLLDKRGYAGDLATGQGLEDLIRAAERRGLKVTRAFLESGELGDAAAQAVAVSEMRGAPEFNGLRAMLEDGEAPFTVTDGVIDEADAPGRNSRLFVNALGQGSDDDTTRPPTARERGIEQYAEALRSALGPVVERVRAIARVEDPKEFAAAIERLKKDLPGFARRLPKNAALAKAMARSMTEAAVRGLLSKADKIARAGKG